MKKSKINECLRKRLLFSQEPVYIRTFWSKKEKSERIIEWKRFHAQVRKIVNTFARLPKKYQSFARLPVCPNFKIFSFALLCFSWKRENVFIHFHDFHLLDHPSLSTFEHFHSNKFMSHKLWLTEKNLLILLTVAESFGTILKTLVHANYYAVE